MHFLLVGASGRRSSEKVGQWTRADGEGLGSYVGRGCDPGKFYIGAKLRNLVPFWRPVQQKMYNSVFSLDFGKSI